MNRGGVFLLWGKPCQFKDFCSNNITSMVEKVYFSRTVISWVYLCGIIRGAAVIAGRNDSAGLFCHLISKAKGHLCERTAGSTYLHAQLFFSLCLLAWVLFLTVRNR